MLNQEQQFRGLQLVSLLPVAIWAEALVPRAATGAVGAALEIKDVGLMFWRAWSGE